MKKTLIDYLRAHSVDGVWTGSTEAGVPVIRYESKTQPAEPFLARLGIKLKKTNKYTERLDNAGMGESQSGGHTSDVGNGVSQEQE
jgi:hypothetical protein